MTIQLFEDEDDEPICGEWMLELNAIGRQQKWSDADFGDPESWDLEGEPDWH